MEGSRYTLFPDDYCDFFCQEDAEPAAAAYRPAGAAALCAAERPGIVRSLPYVFSGSPAGAGCRLVPMSTAVIGSFTPAAGLLPVQYPSADTGGCNLLVGATATDPHATAFTTGYGRAIGQRHRRGGHSNRSTRHWGGSQP